MSNPRTPRQEENLILAGRAWPDWKKPGEESATPPPAPEPTERAGNNGKSWCGLASLHRTPEQIEADAREMAGRKAARIGGAK